MKKIFAIFVLFFAMSTAAVAQKFSDMTVAPHKVTLHLNGAPVECISTIKFLSTMNGKDVYTAYLTFPNKYVERIGIIRHNDHQATWIYSDGTTQDFVMNVAGTWEYLPNN